jgi:hypothetical protein
MLESPNPLAVGIEIKIPKPTLRHHSGQQESGEGVQTIYLKFSPNPTPSFSKLHFFIQRGRGLAHRGSELLSSNLDQSQIRHHIPVIPKWKGLSNEEIELKPKNTLNASWAKKMSHF